MTSIRGLARQAAQDRTITLDEAKALVAKAQEDGVVGFVDKLALRSILVQYKDRFAPGALETVKALLDPRPPTAPLDGRVLSLDSAGARGPIFLTAGGVLTTKRDGTAPTTPLELGQSLYVAAEVADDSPEGFLHDVPFAIREKVLGQLETALATGPSGLDAGQALQLRASAATVLLELIEASPEAQLRGAAVKTLETVIREETNPRLRENLIFHLSNTDAAQSGEVKAIAQALLQELAPTTPPYAQWFANGNQTVNLHWTVGQGEFWKGFTNNLKANGFQPVGAEQQHGVSTYEGTFPGKDGAPPTTFRISVREGGTDILAPMDDAGMQIVGYDGHSNWGRNMTSSVKSGPESSDGAQGKLLFYNLCVGKGVLDRVKEKYPNAQVATTFAASNFYVDEKGEMTKGEGVQALLALMKGVARRDDWQALHGAMNEAADIGSGRTWDNYLTPISTQVREKVLDRDNDGQADYLDKHFNYSTFQVATDTKNELRPLKQDRPANLLDGTKVLVAANMVNTLSEFSGILDRPNGDSKVIAGGWYEPQAGDPGLVRFSSQKGKNGAQEIVMQVSARSAHMSEECLRAVSVFELTRWLNGNGQLKLSKTDETLAGVAAFCQSLQVDEGFRDQEIWSAFLSRFNLPQELTIGTVKAALEQHWDHAYAGDMQVVKALKSSLPPEALAQLAKPEVGVPVTLVG